MQGQSAPQAGGCPLPLASGLALLPQGLFSPMQQHSSSIRCQLKGSGSAAKQVKFNTAGQDRCKTDTGYKTYQATQLPHLPIQEGLHLGAYAKTSA